MSNNIIKINLGTNFSRGKIIPVFIPYAGCPYSCNYCLQDKQTGTNGQDINSALFQLESDINDFIQSNPKQNLEIAFYGGTFTALPKDDLEKCLSTFSKLKNKLSIHGIKTFGRCSTRPDCLGFADNSFQKKQLDLLQRIKEVGIDLIELGIQSFDSLGLSALGRCYDSEIAKTACQYVKDNGFLLGIQLMPSSPSHNNVMHENFSNSILSHLNIEHDTQKRITKDKNSPYFVQSVQTFLNDVELALSYRPKCLRLYPFMILENTTFAKFFHKNYLEVWNLNTTINALAYALHRSWQERLAVIRLSLAPEPQFDKMILAGARHKALGSLIKARALLFSLYHNINIHNNSKVNLHLPKNFQGFIYGDRNFLKTEWNNIKNLDTIFFDTDQESDDIFLKHDVGYIESSA